MAESFSMAVASDDYDKLHGYARVFSELNEALLECMLIEMTFNIWYRLSEHLYERNDDELNAKFRPYIESDDFVEFRMQVSDTLRDVVFIVGTDRCVQSMLSILQTVSSGSWDESEAALYIISVIVHNVLPSETTLVPLLVQAVLNMPLNSHPILIHTSVKLLGNLIDWLFDNSEYQGSFNLEPCINWLLDKVQKPEYVRVASEALNSICEKCENSCLKHFDGLFGVIPLLESGQSRGQQLENSILALLQACASMLNGLPGDEIASRLRRLVEPQLSRLAALLKSIPNDQNNEAQQSKENASDSWASISSDPALWVDRIAAIFRYIQPWTNQPCNPKNCVKNGKKFKNFLLSSIAANNTTLLKSQVRFHRWHIPHFLYGRFIRYGGKLVLAHARESRVLLAC
ncbi:unnamed protein product [Gongylonema pulchrum]|uniref:Importin-13 n=1 Tax=Gongylonema pulchrum TaxID=637853 RepID=A0A183CW59_9BILA|nr:unnamed protein product [Gongylonema pulchrum]